MHLKMSSVKCPPFCFGLNVLRGMPYCSYVAFFIKQRGLVMYICISKWDYHQAIISINVASLSTAPFGTNINEIIKLHFICHINKLLWVCVCYLLPSAPLVTISCKTFDSQAQRIMGKVITSDGGASFHNLRIWVKVVHY